MPNEEEEGACDMPACNWTDWGVWSECAGADCGETGSMSRARDCVPPVSLVQGDSSALRPGLGFNGADEIYARKFCAAVVYLLVNFGDFC